MSLMTQVFLLEKYGTRLSIEQLSEVIGMAPGSIYNQVSRAKLDLPTYIDGKKRWADYRDVAAYIDRCRERAQYSPD